MATDDTKIGKKISDIADPEVVTPSASSRPIIVSNHNFMSNDPMMTSAPEVAVKAAASAAAVPIAVTNHQEKVVARLESTEPTQLTAATEPASKEEKAAAPVDVTETTEAASTDKPQPAAVPAAEESATDDGPTDDAKTAAAAKETKKIDEADAKRQAELEDIIEKGTYAVPINAAQRKRSRMFTIELAVLAVVLFVGMFDLMLDTGIVKMPSVPHTHLFSVSVPTAPATPSTPVAPSVAARTLAKTNIQVLSGYLEAYFAATKSYPTTLTSAVFAAQNITIDPTILASPSGIRYAYTPTPKGCTTAAKSCLHFKLSAVAVSDGSVVLTKQSVN